VETTRLEGELDHISSCVGNRERCLAVPVFCHFRVKYSGIAREQLGSINSQRRVVREGETENEHENDEMWHGGPGRGLTPVVSVHSCVADAAPTVLDAHLGWANFMSLRNTCVPFEC
jgi:hypothetical protein